MTGLIVGSALGLLLGGPLGAVGGALATWVWERARARPPADPEGRLVMILLMVELRSGSSVLGALQQVSERLSEYQSLRRVARVATVSGLVSALGECDNSLRPIVAQLARAQRSGSSLTSSMRTMLEQDLARFRSARLARARAMPVRLMIPVTLLMLPGLVLLLYAPGLIKTFGQLTAGWQ